VFYSFPITIPPNTTQGEPLEIEAPLAHGVIHRLEIGFPDWHWGQTHVYILHKSHQLWPSNPGGSFSSNDHAITFNDYYPLLDKPFQLRIFGWNEDDAFPHTVTVGLGLLPLKVAEHLYGRISPPDLSKLRQAFGLPKGSK
jgi:hypothetical protein